MAVTLGMLHFVYVLVILLVIATMLLKKDTAIICILGILLTGLVATGSIAQAAGGVFNSFVFAINELSGTILIISVITALCRMLELTGVNEVMVSPITSLIRTPASAYWVTGCIMFIVSSFFWPSPAVALIGAVFLPVALRAKLPAIGVAMAMNLFGHGIALSGDFIIQGAPKIVAEGAGLEVETLVNASVPLVFIMGLVTTVTAFILLKRDMKAGRLMTDCKADGTCGDAADNLLLPKKQRQLFAVAVPLVFLSDLVIMFTLKLQGGDASALIGGTALLLLIVLAATAYRGKSFEQVSESIVAGFKFGFTVFGPVIPIAAFFFLGDSGMTTIFGNVLPGDSTGLVNDIGVWLSGSMPVNSGLSAVTVMGVGAITGLDGSGFSGISLVGSVAKLFGVIIGHGAATLAALGQITAIWVGGGTIIPWAVIPVAAICGISPIELAARNFKPVAIGLLATTTAAAIMLL